ACGWGGAPVLGRLDVQPLEPDDLVLREALVGEIGERASPPERQRGTQLLCGLLVLARCQRGTTLGEGALEPVAVELIGGYGERIARADGSERSPSIRQLLPQRRDAVLEDLGRGGRWAFPPELVDDHVPRPRLVGVQQEQGQHRPLPRSAQRERTFAVERLQRPEYAVVHRGSAPETTPCPGDYRTMGGGGRPVAAALPRPPMLQQSWKSEGGR